MVIRTGESLDVPEGVHLSGIPESDDLLRAACEMYFGVAPSCRAVVDGAGRTEPLVDDAWEAQRSGAQLAEIRLARLVARLVDRRIGFPCWCGADCLDLPQVTDFREFLEALRAQTALQPADFFVRYVPR